MEQSDIQEKVKKLLEFYFGDANLQRDRFLRNIIDTNKPDGCMSFSM